MKWPGETNLSMVEMRFRNSSFISSNRVFSAPTHQNLSRKTGRGRLADFNQEIPEWKRGFDLFKEDQEGTENQTAEGSACVVK